MKPSKALLPLLTAFTACTISVASAAITVTDSSTFQGRQDTGNLNVTVSGWSLNGGNTVAVMYTSEGSTDFTATYGGQSMTVVQVYDGTRFVTAIAYLINPTVSVGDIQFSSTFANSGRNSHVYTLVSLDGVGSVASSGTRTGNGAISYTTDLDDGYVLASAGNNNFNGPAPTISGNPSSVFFSGANDGNHSVIHAHGSVAIAGTYSSTYGGTTTGAIVAFNAIPEPTTAILCGLGMLFLLRRRRG
jgi:hypothetical protein